MHFHWLVITLITSLLQTVFDEHYYAIRYRLLRWQIRPSVTFARCAKNARCAKQVMATAVTGKSMSKSCLFIRYVTYSL